MRIGPFLVRAPTPGLDFLDQVLGLRSWGLILYGALPASLSLLGFIEVKARSIDKLIPILLVSLLPLLLTFLLVRARQKEWYFTSDYLNLRSSITTLLIVACASLIAGAAGIIRDEYRFSLHNLTDHSHIAAMTESFLFGMASLVLSTTLFATILTKGADLPGLPSSGFLIAMGKVRQRLIAIQGNTLWERYEPDGDTKIFDELKSAGDSVLQELEIALSQPGHKLAKRRLRSLKSELALFAQSVRDIKSGGVKDSIVFRWEIHFADFSKLENRTGEDRRKIENLTNERDIIKDRYIALQKLKRLRLGG